MFFSVIVPVYNTSKYLSECINSILNQSFKDFELLILDDGSTDNSPEICDKFAQEDSRIRVIHKENERLMMTRRRAFKEAKGEFFVCVDSDDKLYDNQALEKIHEQVVKTNCDLIIYNYVCGEGGGNPERIREAFDYPYGHTFDSDSKIELYEKLLTTNHINSMCTKCYSRNIVDIDTDYSVWKEDICRAEDFFQSFPILDKATRIAYVKDPLYYYRWSADSISNNVKFKYYNALRCIDNRADGYIEKWNLPENIKEHALRQRIVGIFDVICTCYFQSKKNKKVPQWKQFVKEISKDPYFITLTDNCNKKKILKYYRLLHFLMVHRRVNVAVGVIEMTSFISRIKHKK